MLPVLLFVSIAFGFLSLRLIRSALRSGGAEGWLGLGFLCVGLSMPLRFWIQRGGMIDASAQPAFLLVAHAMMAAGLCGFTLFVARVFRPDEGWARGITALLILLQILSLPALVLFGGHRDEQHFSVAVVGLIRVLPFFWAFLESRRYAKLMRRRLELGLADPIVANRFSLFALWTGALVGLPVLLFAVRVWLATTTETGRLMATEPAARLALAVFAPGMLILGLATIVGLWLSFFPPQAWCSRVEARARAASA